MKKIIGYSEAKKQIKELRNILLNKNKYLSEGIHIPRGLLLFGAPGTGKTVLAKSIAGKGLSFIEVQNKHDAELINDIHLSFKSAKEHSPSVLFIDELDKRLNKPNPFMEECDDEVTRVLIQELDAIKDSDGILVIGTCNTLRGFNIALLRSGRFDRQIEIELPDEDTRAKIFKHYLDKLSIKKNVDCKYVSKITGGISCAMIESVVNETAIEAILNKQELISTNDVRKKFDEIIFKGEAKENKLSEDELRKVAIHEAGHALVGLILAPNQIVNATIMSQGHGHGHASLMTEEGKIMSISDKENEAAIALGGRIAQKIIYKKLFLGAERDLQMAYETISFLAKHSAAYGYQYLDVKRSNQFEAVVEQDNDIVSNKLNEIDRKVEEIISKNIDSLKDLAEGLIKNSFLTKEDMLEILNKNKKGIKKAS